MASELHLHKKGIQRDLINKLSYVQIAEKYHTTKGVVAGFIDRHLKEFTKHKLNKLIEATECKYPIGDPKHKNFKYCKEKVIIDSCYCQEHHNLCYVKPLPLKY